MSNIYYINNFLEYLKIEKRYSVHTLVSYESDLLQFDNYLSNVYDGVSLSFVEMLHVRSYMVELLELRLAKSSVARKISTIKSLYKFLKKEKVINSSPVQLLETPKIDKRLPTFIKEDEITNLFEEFKFEESFNGKRDKLILILLYQTGIRLSELIGLNDRDIRNQEIKVLGKRNKERIIPLSSITNILVIDYLKIKSDLYPKTKPFFGLK